MTDVTRVLIADDSPLFVESLTELVEKDPSLKVAGVAANGQQAVALTAQLRPDVVVMDVMMPVMDGLTAIENIMAETPTPILVVSADPKGRTGELSFEAVRRGALDMLPKPTGWPGVFEDEQQFRERIKLLATVPPVRHIHGLKRTRVAPAPNDTAAKHRTRRKPRVVAIAASTGGPSALAHLLSGLSQDFAATILIVQHLNADFASRLAPWLDSNSTVPVMTAKHKQPFLPGHVYIAPAGVHLVVNRPGLTHLEATPPVEGHRPSGTKLLASVAALYGSSAVGVVMTGMGCDGADGLKSIREAGGFTIAQDEASSVVYGMPKAAVDRGAAELVAPLGEISRVLHHLVTP